MKLLSVVWLGTGEWKGEVRELRIPSATLLSRARPRDLGLGCGGADTAVFGAISVEKFPEWGDWIQEVVKEGLPVSGFSV